MGIERRTRGRPGWILRLRRHCLVSLRCDEIATWLPRHRPPGKYWVALNRRGNTLAFVYTGAMFSTGYRQRSTCGVVMTRPMRLIAVMLAVGARAHPSLAFRGGGSEKPAAKPPAVEAPKSAPLPGKGLSLK